MMLGWLFTACMASAFASEEIDCDNAVNTLQINDCAGQKAELAAQEMATYLAKSKSHNSSDAELIKAIDASQQAWQTYADAHCNAVYTYWREGSIRGVMHATCMEKMIKQRTHALWSNYLTYMDSTAPVLPEPQ
ncbi:DUF1311 domain-containing protein [Motilimonas pumila]|uniref:DUF1311 domain-containing protein n=2 Tax=Motilimonas pumila TaxID=2303987 RepID=A0A418YAT2_9GAMM|nr:DUF1311 domain-containing protein [Motilimonas pumila]